MKVPRVQLITEMSSTEFDQLCAYVRWCGDRGEYYGDRRNFWNRHKKIRKALGMPDGDLVNTGDGTREDAKETV